MAEKNAWKGGWREEEKTERLEAKVEKGRKERQRKRELARGEEGGKTNV